MTPESFLDGRVTLYAGDMLAALPLLGENSVDSVVCDPPYHLTSIVKRFRAEGAAPAKDYTGEKDGATGAYARASAGFMGKAWDGGDIAFRISTWRAVYRVLKPGGHLVAFSGTRIYHRMACAIEDANFEIRDSLMWHYGSGFPKSHDVSKGIDKAAGAERVPTGRVKPGHESFANRDSMSSVQSFKGTMGGEGGFSRPWMDDPKKVEAYHQETAPVTEAARQWQGWGTALKPATEIIVLARKPLSEAATIAANVLRWGTGALNIDGCRIATADGDYDHPGNTRTGPHGTEAVYGDKWPKTFQKPPNAFGRWPANLLHDGSEEVVAAFPETEPAKRGKRNAPKAAGILGAFSGDDQERWGHADSGGSAARFFYTAKADANDRLGSRHPTVKPLNLMQWLVRLVTPRGGLVLDPFAGTGTTAEAAFREGMSCILVEREPEYQEDIRRRMALVLGGPDERRREAIKAKTKDRPLDAGPLFGAAS